MNSLAALHDVGAAVALMPSSCRGVPDSDRQTRTREVSNRWLLPIPLPQLVTGSNTGLRDCVLHRSTRRRTRRWDFRQLCRRFRRPFRMSRPAGKRCAGRAGRRVSCARVAGARPAPGPRRGGSSSAAPAAPLRARMASPPTSVSKRSAFAMIARCRAPIAPTRRRSCLGATRSSAASTLHANVCETPHAQPIRVEGGREVRG